MGIKIQEIFKNHYENFRKENIHRMRKVCDEEARKLIRCKDEKYGHVLYECPECGEEKRVAFTCKSRLCTSCGKVKTDDWQNDIKETIYNVKHRHVVFTIPNEIKHLFRQDRKLLKELMDEASKLMLEYFKRQRKTSEWVPGIVSVLHTFGRPLNWNPHIHMLVTEGAIVDNKEWKDVKYLRYETLRNSWKYKVIKFLSNKYKCNLKIKALLNKVYKRMDNGFYVYAKPNIMQPWQVAKYIGRYVSRPVIAESRIKEYDGINVTYCYERHEDNKHEEKTVKAEEFIGLLLMHVPDRQFKMVRYYGVYSRRIKSKIKQVMKERGKILKRDKIEKTFEARIKKAFGIEIFKCPNCGEKMQFKDIIYKGESLLEKIYENMYNKVEKELKKHEKTREDCA